jgi:hypothetical protein
LAAGHDARMSKAASVLKSAKWGDGLEEDGFLKRVGFVLKLGLSKLANANATIAHEVGRMKDGNSGHLSGLV